MTTLVSTRTSCELPSIYIVQINLSDCSFHRIEGFGANGFGCFEERNKVCT